LNVAKVKKYCTSLTGVHERLSGEPSNVLVYKVGIKKFAYFKTSDPEKWRFSLKVSKDRFLELTDQPGIKPARYMHRFYWVTIVNVNAMSPEYLTELINWSYDAAFSALSKKKQSDLSSLD
jgi:predicted DNA-binding protein (MmcQ/YjbR family)